MSTPQLLKRARLSGLNTMSHDAIAASIALSDLTISRAFLTL
jgi:hypothetical protein